MQCKSYSHFFSKKFQHICVSLDVNFNESLTNDIVSFEQLGPGLLCISGPNKANLNRCFLPIFASKHIWWVLVVEITLWNCLTIPKDKMISMSTKKKFCLFVLRFYSPVNPLGSCPAWSVYLTRIVHILLPETDNCPS